MATSGRGFWCDIDGAMRNVAVSADVALLRACAAPPRRPGCRRRRHGHTLHLLWRQQLVVDLSTPLSMTSEVRA